ncbi:DUF6520 family protein [Chitinophaga sp. 22321]|uniref:NVEALA protein n=1 Tax=Chitinophaga hostae TaxID=2831022 RepID=A0ABS5IWQ2_9BACT|nr:DUF6520 family protein [Chitinophaga hostae]MBS0027216.1 hypothetical protein [Chitinophaga hostae]
MKKLILPAALVLMGAGAAFATKMNSGKRVIVDGYRIDAVSGQCVDAEQKCSTNLGLPCTWSEDPSVTLHEAPVTPTMCGNELFKP